MNGELPLLDCSSSGEQKTTNHVKNLFDLLSYVADKSELVWWSASVEI